MSPAMAALAAARAGSNKGGAGRSAPAPAAPVQAAAPATPAAPVAQVKPVEMAAPPPWERDIAPSDGFDTQAASAPPPWEEHSAPTALAEKKTERVVPRDTTGAAPQADDVVVAEQTVAVPVADTGPLVLQPVAELNWNGDWPGLAAQLLLRGAAQQLVLQSELIRFEGHGAGGCFYIRNPVETWATAANIEKVSASLSDYFSKAIRVEVTIGAAVHTATARAEKARIARLKEAEEALQADPFIQTMQREFGARIVEGSIRPL